MFLYYIVFGLIIQVQASNNGNHFAVEECLQRTSNVEKQLERALTKIDNLTKIIQDGSAISSFYNPNDVAFRSELESDIQNIAEGAIVRYKASVNYGNGYDNSTGIFTCPMSGLYMFSIFVAAGNGDYAHLIVKRNGVTAATALSYPAYDGDFQTGGNTAVSHLNQGDRVWVETYGKGSTGLRGAYTSFSGVLIHH